MVKRPNNKLSPRIRRPNIVGSYIGIILLIVLADQITKYFVDKSTIVKNEGIIFGLTFANSNQIMIGASIGAAIVLLIFIFFVHLRGKKLYATIVGGIKGNLIDRIQYGYVVDWIRVGEFPVFNIADAAISVSVVLLILYSVYAGSVYRRNRDRFMGKLAH